MDPLSISAAVAGFIALVATTVTSTNNYVAAVRDANSSARQPLLDLQTLQANLNRFQDYLCTSKDMHEVLENSVLMLQLRACQKSLEDLQRKLDTGGTVISSSTAKLLWPLNVKNHQKVIQEVRAVCQCLALSLIVDNHALLLHTARDGEKTLEHQLESLTLLHQLQSQNLVVHDAIDAQTKLLLETWSVEKRKELLDWISPAGYLEKHLLVQQARATDTELWIVKREEFCNWNEAVEDCGILWCHGIPGSGKTVLT